MTVHLFSVPFFSVGLHRNLNMCDENQKYFPVTQLTIVFNFCMDTGCNSFKNQAS